MYLITSKGLQCLVAANTISDTNRSGWDGLMERWGFRTLFSGLGHSDPVLGVRYTLLLPHTSSSLTSSVFSQLERPGRSSETVRCILSWKDILTSREKGELYFFPCFSFSISDMSKNEGEKKSHLTMTCLMLTFSSVMNSCCLV